MGAQIVDSVDNDETAVLTAIENAKINHVNINFQTATIDSLNSQKYDFVASNILHNVLRDIMSDIKRILKIGGKTVLSGILDEKADIVYDAIIKNNLKVLEKVQEKEWIAFIAERVD
jgi:ribosomal protein L11 methyltransferase